MERMLNEYLEFGARRRRRIGGGHELLALASEAVAD